MGKYGKDIDSRKKLIFFTLGILLFSIITTMKLTILWFLFIGIYSIYLIYINRRNIDNKDIIIGLILCILVALNNPFFGILTFISYIAASLNMKGNKNEILLYDKSNKNSFKLTIISIFSIGFILTIINILLMKGNIEFNPSFSFKYITMALRAGIFEEIFFRMFLYSLCISISNDISDSRFESILTYIVMVIPHVLSHFNGSIKLGSVITLSIIFGLPFSIMMRKVNILSAIGAHALVDIVRFVITGGL